MNKITDSQIMNRINRAYDDLIAEYDEKRILGVFAKGNANYGFASNEYDFSLIAIYLPTFEELCITTPMTWQADGVKMYDIRNFYTAAHQFEDTSLELLYGYSKISPIYDDIFYKKLIKKRDVISYFNVRERILKAKARAQDAVKNNNPFEAYRLLTSVQLYLKGFSVQDCFYIKNDYLESFLWKIKENGLESPQEETLNFISKEFDFYYSTAEDSVDTDADIAIREGVIALLSHALNQTVPKETFNIDLTSLEKDALEFLLKNLDNKNEGNVVISKLVDVSGISRPVFKNLLLKLDRCKVATVVNQGVKGTYIKINKNIEIS